MRAAFHTFGCKLNQYETEALASECRNQGFSLVSLDQPAELYIINTCTVTTKSEQKARRLIRKISRDRSESLLIVTGCYAQLNAQDLAALGSNVQVVSQEQKAALLDLPRLLKKQGSSADASLRSVVGPQSGSGDPFRFHVDNFSFHSRAFLKVQDGCDYRCSYCRVPLARGRSMSLDPQQAVLRAREIEEHGYSEVVLTGVNLTAYQHGQTDLPALLQELLANCKRLRLRLSSLEPEMIDEELTEVLRHPRIRPHFHIPVQSGSNAVLLRMRRRYRSDRVVTAVTLLRRVKEDPFLAADVIVGFPGETDDEFQETRELIQSLGMSKLHVFPFSPRPGTAAQHMADPVPERIRDNRAHTLLSLSESLHESYSARWLGRRVEAVLERGDPASKNSGWRALSDNYLKLLVEGIPGESRNAGSLVLVEIAEADDPCRARYISRI